MSKSTKSSAGAEVAHHEVEGNKVVPLQTKKRTEWKGANAYTEMSAIRQEAISGHLEGVDDEGRLLFKPEGAVETIPVVIGIPLSDDELVKAARLGQRALALHTSDRVPRLILIGLLRERVKAGTRDAPFNELKVRLDGETLHFTAKRQIELVCGKSRMVLHKNGRIEFKGSYLLSRSRGPNKIKGATVEIN